MSKREYKTSRKYKCPYCDFKAVRGDLVDHVDKKHEELIPEGYSSARAVYDFINNKNHGTCMICKKDVYKWNDKINRYYNLCDDPKCRAAVRETALKNHIRVYNKPTLLDDPEQQEKMLANRKISGSYTFHDGVKVTYTGKYERNALEFMDKVLNIPGNDIQAPGPVFDYEYNGKTHKWITDIYYIPGNLVIEVKDGGSNPNRRSMVSYREKQVVKEKMITANGTYNYLRLTDNDFSQLLAVLADMKNEALTHENPKATIHINEEVGGLPSHRPPEAYIVPYGMNNVFDGFAYTDDTMDNEIVYPNADGNICTMTKSDFSNKFNVGPMLFYKDSDKKEKVKSIHEALKRGDIASSRLYFAELFLGRKLYKYEEVLMCESFKYLDLERERKICKLIENGILIEAENAQFNDSNVVKTVDNVLICRSAKGYYAATPAQFYMASEYFPDVEMLMSSGVVELMNNVYKNKTGNAGGGSR